MTEQSKFVLTYDRSATAVNQRPNLKGEYQLAGEETTTKLALWGGTQKNSGLLYAKGQATPESISDALRASKSQSENVDLPPNLDLKVGEAVLFENEKSTKENRQPKFYGYAREATRVVRLAGWERGNIITGNAEPYRPAASADAVLPSADFE
ncbi:hypothetical protein [Hyphomicrobium sp.]|jgi:hypothetical protein|uniref:hypothetical protein n=1 Tax=Hyphomicrobium sp. TaxID=82 RepID=UPI003561F68A